LGNKHSKHSAADSASFVGGQQNPGDELNVIQQVLREQKRKLATSARSHGRGRKQRDMERKQRKQCKRSKRAKDMLQQGLDVGRDDDDHPAGGCALKRARSADGQDDNNTRIERDRARDVSASVVVGAYTGRGVGHLPSTSAEHFDAVMFSQSKGINSGFVDEDPWEFSAPSRETRDLNRRV
jgi:hypothetical protein